MELGNLVFGNSRGNYPIDRHTGYEKELERLFESIDSGYQGYCPEFENETFWVFPYYWGDCTCGGEEYCVEGCLTLKDNFYYKPLEFGIQWYKYPLRDSYMSHDISLVKFTEVIDKCIASLDE